jgi:DNA polymerase-1
MSRGLSESVLYDQKAVEAKYQLSPDQIVDYKALRGDPSDNIPGVKGVGDKTATELLLNFQTLDGVYENLESDKIKDRIRELLRTHKKEAYLSQELATIKRDVPIDFKLEAAAFIGVDKDSVLDLFSQLEFKSLLPRVQEMFGSQAQKTAEGADADKFERNRREFQYMLVDSDKDFEDFLKKMSKQNFFTFDTETSGCDHLSAYLLGVSFCWQPGEAYYVNLRAGKDKPQGETNLFNYDSLDKIGVRADWIDKLKPAFEDKNVGKAAHNAKFDIRVLHSAGIKFRGLAFDTMLASYLLNPGTRQHGLDALVFSELQFEKISKEDLLGKGRNKCDWTDLETGKLSLYSCEDADFTHRLIDKLKPRLGEHELDKLYNEIELPLVEVLVKMEESGIKLDLELLKRIGGELNKKTAELERKIHKQAGRQFNIKSTQQLQEVLFEDLEIPTELVAKTKTGLSTAADELEKLKEQHPIIPLLQEYRELVKLSNTYVDALSGLVDKKTSRLHTSFNQTVTATGRLSSTEPNLQNIPARTETGRKIRSAFITERGWELVAFDYSQIELRLAAHLSEDKKMIKAFQKGADIHTATAAEINEVDPEEVTKEMRTEAKAINFGILYGQGPHGLSQTADIPYARAKAFIDQYFAVYQGVKEFVKAKPEEAREHGYVQTMFGRRRYLPEINSTVPQVRKGAERIAVNTPLQGSAADIIKIAMLRAAEIMEEMNKEKEQARMLLQVHDELLFEVKKGAADKLVGRIRPAMEDVVKLKVPFIVDVSKGKNWGEMEKIS